jgi:predicted O-methyltransferase YrrM
MSSDVDDVDKVAGHPDYYALGRSAAETQRLILQNQIYGPFTRQLLSAAGITAGMKVLDLGSGAGDVALLLADLVGPEGRIVGIDTNADVLDTARTRVQAAGWQISSSGMGTSRTLTWATTSTLWSDAGC